MSENKQKKSLRKKKKIFAGLILIILLFAIASVYASVSCSDCSRSGYVYHTFGQNDSIYVSGLNMSFFSNLSLFYQTLQVNLYNVSFYCLTTDNSTGEGLDVSFDGFNSEYTYLRLLKNRYSIAYTDNCSSDLAPYKYQFESGCQSYVGTRCQTDIFTGLNYANYTLLKQNISELVPNWANPVRSCLYSAVNTTSNNTVLIHAFRVSGNGGQLCTIQDRWDYFVYTPGFNEHYIPLTPFSFRDSTFVNYDCVITDEYRNSTFWLDDLPFDLCVNFSVPSNYTNWTDYPPVVPVSNSPEIYESLFYNGSCSSKFNLFILFLWIIIIFIMIYLQMWIFASFLTLMFAIVLLYCGVNIIFLVVLLTIALALGFIRSRINP